jgi:hypothetical protein
MLELPIWFVPALALLFLAVIGAAIWRGCSPKAKPPTYPVGGFFMPKYPSYPRACRSRTFAAS